MYRRVHAGAAELNERAPREPGAGELSAPHEATCGAAGERVGAMSVQRRHPAEAQLEGACAARGGPAVPFVGFLLLFAALILVPSLTSAAEIFVRPGDTGQIEYPVEHLTDSAGPLEGLELSATAPAHFIVKGTSIRGPFTSDPGETKIFVIDYEIAAGTPENPTPEGPFTVRLVLSATTEGIDPDLNSPETTVNLMVDTTSPDVALHGNPRRA